MLPYSTGAQRAVVGCGSGEVGGGGGLGMGTVPQTASNRRSLRSVYVVWGSRAGGWVAGGCGWRQKARSCHGAVEGLCGGGGVVATRGRNPWQTHHQVVAHGHHGHHADPVRGAPTAITHKRARAALWFDAQPWAPTKRRLKTTSAKSNHSRCGDAAPIIREIATIRASQYFLQACPCTTPPPHIRRS